MIVQREGYCFYPDIRLFYSERQESKTILSSSCQRLTAPGSAIL